MSKRKSKKKHNSRNEGSYHESNMNVGILLIILIIFFIFAAKVINKSDNDEPKIEQQVSMVAVDDVS